MGSSLSSIVSDIVMQDLEMKALQRLPISPSFYVRYVDDIALAHDALYIDILHWLTPLIHSIPD